MTPTPQADLEWATTNPVTFESLCCDAEAINWRVLHQRPSVVWRGWKYFQCNACKRWRQAHKFHRLGTSSTTCNRRPNCGDCDTLHARLKRRAIAKRETDEAVTNA